MFSSLTFYHPLFLFFMQIQMKQNNYGGLILSTASLLFCFVIKPIISGL